MKRSEKSSPQKLERKTVEKNRRIQKRSLGFKLVSIIPDLHFTQPKEFLSHLDQIDEATEYIKILRERIEGLKRRKAGLEIHGGGATGNVGGSSSKPKTPVVTVKELGSGVEVVVVSEINKSFKLGQVIKVIEEEAAEVITVNVARIGYNIIHTVHAQAKISRVGVDTSRINDRIQEFIYIY